MNQQRRVAPDQGLVRAFLTLYVALGLVVCYQSIQTIASALQGHTAPANRAHAILLGALETAAAVLFLIPRTMRWGAAGLIGIFCLAFLLHLSDGHPNLALIVYAAAVLFVRVHGVQGYRWSAVAG